MRHANALSQCVQLVVGDYLLTREKIKEAREKDSLCGICKMYEKFWLDEDQLLYCEETEGCSTIVIPEALVRTVLRCCHELPCIAHQGIARRIAVIKRKYLWEYLSKDITEYINACERCPPPSLPHLGACSCFLEHRAEFPQFLDQGQLVGLLGRVISSSRV
jgi:hypothetical protein